MRDRGTFAPISGHCLWLLLSRYDVKNVALATVSPPVIIVLYGSEPWADGGWTQLPSFVIIYRLVFLNPEVNPVARIKREGAAPMSTLRPYSRSFNQIALHHITPPLNRTNGFIRYSILHRLRHRRCRAHTLYSHRRGWLGYW